MTSFSAARRQRDPALQDHQVVGVAGRLVLRDNLVTVVEDEGVGLRRELREDVQRALPEVLALLQRAARELVHTLPPVQGGGELALPSKHVLLELGALLREAVESVQEYLRGMRALCQN